MEISEDARQGRRYVYVHLDIKPVGSIRQNRSTRWLDTEQGRRVREYNNYKSVIKDFLRFSMQSKGIKKMERVYLSFSGEFRFLDEKALLGTGTDIDNLTKAVLDSCNGILITDDRWVIHLHDVHKVVAIREGVEFVIGEA